VALRIYLVMRWLVLLVMVVSLGGCDQPHEDFQSPFLRLRQEKPEEDSPDGGEIKSVPIGDPANPGRPVD
jgi:hypothetical protein